LVKRIGKILIKMVAIWYINPVFYTKSTIDEDIEIDVIPFPKGI